MGRKRKCKQGPRVLPKALAGIKYKEVYISFPTSPPLLVPVRQPRYCFVDTPLLINIHSFPSLLPSLPPQSHRFPHPPYPSNTHRFHRLSSKMSPIRDTLIQTANNYITGFNTNTAEGVIACRTTDCKQAIHPSSVPPPWNSPPRTNEEYQGFVVPGFQMVRNVQIGLAKGEDMLVDEALRKVLLHLTSTGETDFGPYANEYMIVLKMTDDGTQIKEIVEFIDSATTRDIAAGLAQHAKPE